MELDRVELRDSARRMFAASGLAPDRDRSWSLIVEMGWLGLTAPEGLGGLGQGRAALGALYIELGRVLGRAPFLPAMLAIETVCRSPDRGDRQAWVDRLFGGELVTTSLSPQTLGASEDADGCTIRGMLSAVADADQATHLLVWAGDLCGLLPLAQAGVQPRRVWDETRRLFDVQIENARLSSDLVLARGAAATGLAGALQTDLLFALAADSVGAAAALLEMTLEYLQTRRQFARPLAMFQALKHRCADLKAMTSAAEALLWDFAAGTGSGGLDPMTQAGLLKSHAASVFHSVAEEAVQLHGGIGLTAEHPCHLFLKRALLNASLAGDSDAWEATAGEQAILQLARR